MSRKLLVIILALGSSAQIYAASGTAIGGPAVVAGPTMMTVGAAPNPGYWVMSKSTWNGNLGGLAAADSKCLTELSTTNTGWMGYSTANANGQLVSAKVHAFLCSDNACTFPAVSSTFYFADANNSAHGGASFTTDASGDGPFDSTNWSGATFFGASYNYWIGAPPGNVNTYWGPPLGPGNSDSGGGSVWTTGASCSNWSATTGSAYLGISNATDAQRWDGYAGNQNSATCSTVEHLLCFVNP